MLPSSNLQKPARLGASSITWRAMLRHTVNLLYPPACALCQAEAIVDDDGEHEVRLCEACRQACIDPRPACRRCGMAPVVAADEESCGHCRNARFHFQAVVRLGSYEGALRRAVLEIKSSRQRVLAMALADLLATVARADLLSLHADAILPIPMHWSRRLLRGTNSPQTLAEILSRQLNLPLAAHLVSRRRRTAPQARLSPRKRLTNVRGAFAVRATRGLRDKRILLVDDIMTTGATVNEVAKILTKAGAQVVGTVVLARADGAG